MNDSFEQFALSKFSGCDFNDEVLDGEAVWLMGVEHGWPRGLTVERLGAGDTRDEQAEGDDTYSLAGLRRPLHFRHLTTMPSEKSRNRVMLKTELKKARRRSAQRPRVAAPEDTHASNKWRWLTTRRSQKSG